MATEEIQISQLELAQEVQGDMVFAVDTATDTKSLSVNQLKNHISQPLQANINAVDTSALHKYNISNCITEIPQDIKLELNNGTLTLKAGSKVYVPNGASFDTVTITEDKAYIVAIDSTPLFMFINSNGQQQRFGITQCFSGTTAPSGQTYMIWYDTTNNLIKYTGNGGSTWESGWSFPTCIIHGDGTKISNIDQVFNGFGYIGSTVFALPGVKGLIPNGRNEDGSLKNIEFTIDSVKTATRTWIDGDSRQCWGYIKNPPSGATETWYWNSFIESETEPSNTGYCMWYKPSENITYMNNQDGATNWQKVSYIDFGKASGINSKEVKIFTPKTAFHALDYNDFEKAMLKEDWVKVSTLPASPDSSKFYYIPEN